MISETLLHHIWPKVGSRLVVFVPNRLDAVQNNVLCINGERVIQLGDTRRPAGCDTLSLRHPTEPASASQPVIENEQLSVGCGFTANTC